MTPGMSQHIGPQGLVKSRKRILTQRGVLWLGQTCNQRCYFCYFLHRIEDSSHPEHPFMTLDKAKAICKTMRDFYGNTSIDIQGGEPTIYPEIFELIRYCREIGLLPTLITNGILLERGGELEKYKEAGLRDFLVSLHGLDEVHDEVVGFKGAYAKISTAIDGMGRLDIPFRFNCTMSKPVIGLLPDIARKAVETGALVVNYIAFNPFEDQEGDIRTHENVPKYSDIRPYLTEAMDILEEAGIEVNVRYIPLCMAEERHRKNFYNFQQFPYDIHEWDYQSWLWTGMKPQRMKSEPLVPPFLMGPLYNRVARRGYKVVNARCEAHPLFWKMMFAAQHNVARIARIFHSKEQYSREEARLRAAHHKYDAKCQDCAACRICDGLHGDYAEFFGTDEAEPIEGLSPIDDPLYYVKEQEKVIEPEEQGWAS